MYLPQLHEERELGVLQALIRAHPFGTLMCHVARAKHGKVVPTWNYAAAAVACCSR